jgi:hypothetical protein
MKGLESKIVVLNNAQILIGAALKFEKKCCSLEKK